MAAIPLPTTGQMGLPTALVVPTVMGATQPVVTPPTWWRWRRYCGLGPWRTGLLDSLGLLFEFLILKLFTETSIFYHLC